jgi:hypothetical protein
MDHQRIADAFRDALNRHGYGFQYAVLRLAEDAANRGSAWLPWIPEFPVTVQGAPTRIDLVFLHRSGGHYMVAECKRANPATAHWCFAATPEPHSHSLSGRSYIETLRKTPEGQVLSDVKDLLNSANIFQIGLEVRTGQTGDKAEGRGEIESAATQVCRSLNGFAEFLKGRADTLLPQHAIGIVPVIFTTATLFVTNSDVSAAKLQTGKLENVQIEPRDWLWLDYPQSPGLKHSLLMPQPRADLREIYYREFVRRVAIVSADGIDGFLRSQLWQHAM